MLRAVLRFVFGSSKSAAIKTGSRPARFAPALHALEAREVPAVAAFGTVADLSLADAVDSDGSTQTAKVTFQDFSFTAKMSKSSPK